VGVAVKTAAQVGDPDQVTVHLGLCDFEMDEKTDGRDSLAEAHQLDGNGVD
jgi:hypothetical protein